MFQPYYQKLFRTSICCLKGQPGQPASQTESQTAKQTQSQTDSQTSESQTVRKAGQLRSPLLFIRDNLFLRHKACSAYRIKLSTNQCDAFVSQEFDNIINLFAMFVHNNTPDLHCLGLWETLLPKLLKPSATSPAHTGCLTNCVHL